MDIREVHKKPRYYYGKKKNMYQEYLCFPRKFFSLERSNPFYSGLTSCFFIFEKCKKIVWFWVF